MEFNKTKPTSGQRVYGKESVTIEETLISCALCSHDCYSSKALPCTHEYCEVCFKSSCKPKMITKILTRKKYYQVWCELCEIKFTLPKDKYLQLNIDAQRKNNPVEVKKQKKVQYRSVPGYKNDLRNEEEKWHRFTSYQANQDEENSFGPGYQGATSVVQYDIPRRGRGMFGLSPLEGNPLGPMDVMEEFGFGRNRTERGFPVCDTWLALLSYPN